VKNTKKIEQKAIASIIKFEREEEIKCNQIHLYTQVFHCDVFDKRFNCSKNSVSSVWQKTGIGNWYFMNKVIAAVV